MSLNERNCARCSKTVLKTQVKYDPTGSKLVCKDCSDYLSKKDIPDPSKKKVATHFTPEKIRFVCLGCGYKFSLRKGSNHDSRCPYCESRRVKVDNVNAYSILDDVNELD